MISWQTKQEEKWWRFWRRWHSVEDARNNHAQRCSSWFRRMLQVKGRLRWCQRWFVGGKPWGHQKWRRGSRSIASSGTLLTGEMEEPSVEQKQRIKGLWPWFWTWRRPLSESAFLFWAWISQERSCGSFVEASAVRRMCGGAAQDHYGYFARVQVELLAFTHCFAGCVERSHKILSFLEAERFCRWHHGFGERKKYWCGGHGKKKWWKNWKKKWRKKLSSCQSLIMARGESASWLRLVDSWKENVPSQFSKEGVTLADGVETLGVVLRTRIEKLGEKEKARRRKCKVRISIIMKKKAFQKNYTNVGDEKLLRAGKMPARTWGAHAVGMSPTKRLKLRREMAAAAGKKSTTSLSLFIEAPGLEVKDEISTMATQYWAEGAWTGKWSHEQKEGAVMCETRDPSKNGRNGRHWCSVMR